MKRKKPIGEDFVQTRTEEVSSAIIEKEVKLLSPQFQSCFELDAWLELTGLSISFIILGLGWRSLCSPLSRSKENESPVHKPKL